MSKEAEVDTSFIEEIKKNVKEGMQYHDAMLYVALMAGGESARLISQAMDKYEEATYEKTELFKQENVDECALASMGTLWHSESYNGSQEQMNASEEETILDALYFILKYAQFENALEEALKANDNVCGDKIARKVLIEKAFDLS